MATPPARTPLTPAQAATLLDRLQNDDAFRSAFAASPTEALAGLGVVADLTGPLCDPVQALASKEEFASVSQQLQAHVALRGSFDVPYCFEAGKVQEALEG